MAKHPFGCDDRQTILGMAHGFSNHFQTIEFSQPSIEPLLNLSVVVHAF